MAQRSPTGPAPTPECAKWSCLELTGARLRLSARGYHDACHELLLVPAQQCPQHLLAALVQCAPAGSASATTDQVMFLVPAFLLGIPLYYFKVGGALLSAYRGGGGSRAPGRRRL